MDVYCQKCGEPWDVFALHDFDKEVENGRERFLQGEGCPCCIWGAQAPEMQPPQAYLMGTVRELLGDDVDGMASLMADAEPFLKGNREEKQ